MCVVVCKKKEEKDTSQELNKFHFCVCKMSWKEAVSLGIFYGLYCTICGISLQALAFFLARASHGGSSCVRGAGTVWLMLLFSFSTSTGLDISKEHDTNHRKKQKKKSICIIHLSYRALDLFQQNKLRLYYESNIRYYY